MYKIILPILGFEQTKNLKIIKQDEYFSTIVLDNEAQIKIHIVNINYLNKIPLNFNIEEDVLEKLNIEKQEDVDIFFCLVVQNPIEDSIVNLIAPILINHEEKLIGQYVTKNKTPRLFATLNETTTL